MLGLAGFLAVSLTIVGTNDLHGQVGQLPTLAGYINNIKKTQPNVLLLDGGDMFQGTLESNLGEGRAVVDAYNAMGYAAAAVGNHEFDFGPAGSASVPRNKDEDPLGALRARAK